VGDDGESDRFVATSSAGLHRTAYLLVGDWARAEDLVQIDAAGRSVWTLPGMLLQVAASGRLACWLSPDGHTLSAHDTATGRTVGTLALPRGGYVAGFWRGEVLVARPTGANSPNPNALTVWDPASGHTSSTWGASQAVHATGVSPDGRYPIVVQTVLTAGNTTTFRACLVELDPTARPASHATFCLPTALSQGGGTSTESPDHRWLVWVHDGKGYRIDLRAAFTPGAAPRPVAACAGAISGTEMMPVWEDAADYLMIQPATPARPARTVLRCRIGATIGTTVRDPRLPTTDLGTLLALAQPES
jgi:hypothetical protein